MTNDSPPRRWRAVALLVVAFVAGAAVGAFADRAYVASARRAIANIARIERRMHEPPTADQIPLPLEQLDLTPAERDSLHAIARRWRPRAAEALDEIRRRVGSMENLMFADMLCVLTPEQRARYKASLDTEGFPPDLVALRFKRVNDGTCGSTADR